MSQRGGSPEERNRAGLWAVQIPRPPSPCSPGPARLVSGCQSVVSSSPACAQFRGPRPGLVVQNSTRYRVFLLAPGWVTIILKLLLHFLMRAAFQRKGNRSRFSLPHFSLGSGPRDHVFVYFTDHGAPGILAFPNDDVSFILNHAHECMCMFVCMCVRVRMVGTEPRALHVLGKYSTAELYSWPYFLPF